MRIVLCCAGGLSTTMLMNSMKDTVHNSAKLNDADFDFIAIPIDILQSEADNCDVLVLGPQVAHKLDAVKPIIELVRFLMLLLIKKHMEKWMGQLS